MKKSELGENDFENLLGWLDADRNRAGQKYEFIRRCLIKIFYGFRCSAAEDLADETINRVARKADILAASYEGEPAFYFYGVAKKVFLEFTKLPKTEPLPAALSEPESKDDEREENYQQCLNGCLAKLPDEQNRLIIEYYSNEKRAKINRRKNLTEQLGISNQTLRVRVLRIRQSLQKCASNCTRKNF